MNSHGRTGNAAPADRGDAFNTSMADQGAMSAWAAVERLMVGSSDLAEDQEVFARYPFSVNGV